MHLRGRGAWPIREWCSDERTLRGSPTSLALLVGLLAKIRGRYPFWVTRPPLDPARGAEVARELKALGVKGPLIKAAELGYITDVLCGMPTCFCPDELGGAGYFAPRAKQWNDWEATFEHFPIPKVEGGRVTVENAVLAHRLCNKLDHFIRNGLSIEKDLTRVEKAREEAAGHGDDADVTASR
jgi:hypothetical protein